MRNARGTVRTHPWRPAAQAGALAAWTTAEKAQHQGHQLGRPRRRARPGARDTRPTAPIAQPPPWRAERLRGVTAWCAGAGDTEGPPAPRASLRRSPSRAVMERVAERRKEGGDIYRRQRTGNGLGCIQFSEAIALYFIITTHRFCKRSSNGNHVNVCVVLFCR
jgi:hypothetical protein